MRASGSTFLPWLLIGPILVAVGAMIVHQATGIEAFAVVAQVGLGIAVALMALAFVAGWRSSRRAGRS